MTLTYLFLCDKDGVFLYFDYCQHMLWKHQNQQWGSNWKSYKKYHWIFLKELNNLLKQLVDFFGSHFNKTESSVFVGDRFQQI